MDSTAPSHPAKTGVEPDGQALARFEPALAGWVELRPNHLLRANAPWQDFFAWSWAGELSGSERALLSRMDPNDAFSCLLRGYANSGCADNTLTGAELRRMGRAMHCAELACRTTVMSHPWNGSEGNRWIDEPEPAPQPSRKWARMERAERWTLAGAPWALAASVACTAIPAAAVPASLVAFGSLCLVLARQKMANRAQNPHKQAIISTLEAVYPELWNTGFFSGSLALPNFRASTPLESCERAIDHLSGADKAPSSRYRDDTDFLMGALPAELAWTSARAVVLRESTAIEAAVAPASEGPSARRPLRM